MDGGSNLFESKAFTPTEVLLTKTRETVLQGGRDKFPLAAKTLIAAGVRNILVVGWGSQGPAQAQNLHDALVGTGIKVCVGLQKGSTSFAKAREAGFSEQDGTLGEMYELITKADLVILLISDSAQVENYEPILAAMKPGATLGLSHGFLIGHLQNVGETFPDDINVVGVCPKGMGPSVRRLFIQGQETEGAGINCSFAVEQDIDGNATDIALAWAILIGAPWIFKTTLTMEYRSDLFGERAVLLGAVAGIVKALYAFFIAENHMTEEDAFKASVENVTGPLSRIISEKGLLGVLEKFNEGDRYTFNRAFSAAYGPFLDQFLEIYDEVYSGNEIRGVVMAGARLASSGKEMPKIDKTTMWRVGESVRNAPGRDSSTVALNPVTAGIYCAAMMAQIDILIQKGHYPSEICNETVIEAVDSLNPFMDFLGIAWMVDNCSTTARLGTRKWAPIIAAILEEVVLVGYMEDTDVDWDLIGRFEKHEIHGALKKCAEMRPSVSISLN